MPGGLVSVADMLGWVGLGWVRKVHSCSDYPLPVCRYKKVLLRPGTCQEAFMGVSDIMLGWVGLG
jgi:hypothetical protein